MIENFFKNKFNKNIHEISFYYTLVSTQELDTNNFTVMENDKGNIIKLDFKWIDINEIDKFDIRPEFLKEILKNKLIFNHLVIDELKIKDV